jgi:ribosome maturation factor RimP
MANPMTQKDDRLKSEVVAVMERPLAHFKCELADLVISRYKSSVTLRVFIYAEAGVTLELCSDVSRVIGEQLEETELLEDGYTLEVSSPGLDRPLTTVRDFYYRAGETVRVRFADKKRKKITARIVVAAENTVTFADDTGEFDIPLAEIDQATIVF